MIAQLGRTDRETPVTEALTGQRADRPEHIDGIANITSYDTAASWFAGLWRRGDTTTVAVLVLALLLSVVGCDGSPRQIEISVPPVAACLDESDYQIALAGVVVTPPVGFGEPLPIEAKEALTGEGLSPNDFETVFVLNGSLILHSADGWAAREGSTDAVVELVLLKDVETEKSQWLVLYWRVGIPCEDRQRSD